MVWTIKFDSAAEKQLRKIERTWQKRIIAYLDEVVALPDPRVKGKALTSSLAGLWRYRVEDFRLVFQLQDDVLVVRVIKIGPVAVCTNSRNQA